MNEAQLILIIFCNLNYYYFQVPNIKSKTIYNLCFDDHLKTRNNWLQFTMQSIFVEPTPTTRSKQQRYNKDDDAFISETDMILFYLYIFQTLLFAF